MATSRKPKKKSSEQPPALFDKIEWVPIDSLKPHPKNPNIGDVDSISESIVENGLAQPIILNRRNGYIVGGHHTWLAARQLKYDEVPVVIIDVDDQRHLKLMLALNRTADKRTYDESLLNEIFTLIPDTVGTGYDEVDVAEIASRASQMATEALETLGRAEQDRQEAEDARRRASSFKGAPLGEEDEYLDEEDEDEDLESAGSAERGDSLEAASDELSGAFELKEDIAFDGIGKWGIPKLLTGHALMTYEELPSNLETWAGSATKDWPDPDTWWLYNFSIDSTSGMRDISKVILAFYCHDEYFENWWHYTKKYVSKVLNSGIKYIVMPDFSMHTPGEESRAISMWSFYRNRWLARYFQECGLKLIPDITWATGDEDFLVNIMLPTYPKKIPLLAIQVQTIDEKSKLYREYIKQLQLILDTLQPQALLIYHGKQGERLFTEKKVKFNGPIKMLKSRMYRLAESAKKKQAKKTI